jgi:hypothetical protein
LLVIDACGGLLCCNTTLPALALFCTSDLLVNATLLCAVSFAHLLCRSEQHLAALADAFRPASTSTSPQQQQQQHKGSFSRSSSPQTPAAAAAAAAGPADDANTTSRATRKTLFSPACCQLLCNLAHAAAAVQHAAAVVASAIQCMPAAAKSASLQRSTSQQQQQEDAAAVVSDLLLSFMEEAEAYLDCFYELQQAGLPVPVPQGAAAALHLLWQHLEHQCCGWLAQYCCQEPPAAMPVPEPALQVRL